MAANDQRRKAITLATAGLATIAGVAAATPFVASMAPSRKTKGEGAPVEVDISVIEPGKLSIVAWRRKPIWLLKRTPQIIEEMKAGADDLSDPNSDVSDQPDYCKNDTRSRREDFFVAIGICTHLGCSPASNLPEGFLCACHGSYFDAAGRVKKGSPAPTNLAIPEHYFTEDGRLVIGASEPA